MGDFAVEFGFEVINGGGASLDFGVGEDGLAVALAMRESSNSRSRMESRTSRNSRLNESLISSRARSDWESGRVAAKLLSWLVARRWSSLSI